MILTKGEKTLRFEFETKKIKHAYFHFKDDYVLITRPKHISDQEITNYIHKKYDQFYEKMTRQITIPNYFGLTKSITYIQSKRFSYDVGDEVTIYYTKTEEEALKRFYKEVLKTKLMELEDWLFEALKPIGLKPLPTEIKWLKSKYGSCHIRKKIITLNAYLAKLDPIYLKYVLMHEYAHILVPNHQKPFYDVLDLLMPGHKEIQKALKKHHL